MLTQHWRIQDFPDGRGFCYLVNFYRNPYELTEHEKIIGPRGEAPLPAPPKFANAEFE